MEKQMKLFTNMTKPFVLFALLFALGVGNAWGYWIVRPKVYFYNSEGWTPGILLLGHNANSQGFNFVEVPNTKLWYVHPDIDWHDLSEAHFGIVGDGVNNWDYNSESFTTRWGYVTGTYTEHTSKYDNLQWDNNDYKYITYINSTWTIASGNGAVPTYTAFLRTKVNENDGSGYSLVGNSTTWKASFNFTGTHWSGVDGETAQSTISNLQSNSWMDGEVEKFGYGNIPFSGKVRFVKQSINSAYELAGWGTEGDTEPIWYTDGSGNDVTFYVSKTGTNDNEGVYVAFIKRKQYTVTFDRKGVFGTSTVTATVDETTATSGTLYNYGQEVVYTANPATGYEVEGWYSDAACTVSLNNGTASTYTVSSLEATSSAYVKFREKTFSVAFTNDGHGSVTLPTSTPQTVGQITGIAINASEYFGYQFNTWTSSTGGSFTTATSASTNFYPTAATTVTATFSQMYAFIEANLQVYNSARNARTKTGNNWTDASTAIQMEYDGTNHRFFLHTYSTPAELAEQLNSSDAYFYIRTSTSSSSLSEGNKYYANGSGANQSLSAYGSANKKAIKKDDSSNSFKFTGSEDGYVILYFDGEYVWYELECKVTYDGNDKTGGTTPTDATYYAKGATVTVAAEPASWAKTGYTFGGWNKANDGSGTNYTAGTGTFSINENTTLYAKWTQDVTLDNTGYTTAGSTSVTLTYNSSTHAALTNPAKIGYTFNGWYTGEGGTGSLVINPSGVLQNSVSVSTTNYTDASGNWIYSGSATTLYAKWTANNYTVTFENLSADAGHKGSLDTTVTFNDTINMKSGIEVPSKTHYDFGGYYISTNKGATLTTQIIDANGNWKKGVSGYTGTIDDVASWVCAGDTVLYAKWTEHEYDITIAVTGSGSTSPVSSTTAKYVTASGDITATPSTGYSFREWGFSETGTGNYDVYVSDGSSYKSTDATIRIKAQRDGTLTANFTPRTYTVRFENLGADAGHKGSLDTTVTFNDTINMKGGIEVPSKTNYDFGGYYISTNKGATLTNIQIIDANGNWNKNVSGYTGTKDNVATWVCAGDTVLYAKWTETAYTITPSVSPAGAGSVNTVTDAHLVTPSSDITATPTNAAWIFDYWEYGEHVGHASGSGNAITVRASQNSTITAHFKPRYELVGDIWDGSGNGGMPGWSYDGTGVFTFNSFTALGTGDGKGCDLSCSRTLNANTTYRFQIHDRETGNHGYATAATYIGDGDHLLFNTKDQNVMLAATGAGTYTFRITNITEDDGKYYPTVSVERPHQLHFGTGYAGIDNLSSVTSGTTGGTLAVTTSAGSLSNEDWVTYGTDVTYTPSAATGYTFEGFYSSNEYSDRFTQNNPWVHYNVTGDDNVYAKFEEKSTSVTLANDGNGKVQISSTDKANTTVGITTSREITAVPNTGYSFSSWTVPGGADFSVESTSSATTTLSGLGAGTAGTLTANFTENMHAVTVKAGSGGSVSSDPALSDGKVTIGITTSATLTATPANAAWVFKNWTGDIDDGITIASGSATSATITINATADSKSITANFEPRYGLHGSLANDTPGGMPGWAGDGADFAVSSFSGIGEGDGKGVDLRCARTLEPNKEYKFRIYDRAADGRWGYSSSVTLGAGESLTLSTYGDVSGKDVKIYTVGYGTYTFKITNMYDNSDGKYYPKVTVDRPTSYQFNMGCTEGGTVTAATTAGSGYAITNGQYVAAGDDIQFHAVPAAGYAFDHWYTASDYATSFNDNKDMKMNNISETVNAYAKFVPVAVTFTNNSGSGDGKWSTASNWSPACVPTIDHDVVITKPVTVDIAHAVANRIVLDQNSKTGKLTIEANKGLEVVGTITRTTDGSDRLATREEDLVLESSSAGNASLIFNNSNSCAATVQMYSKATIVGDTWNWQYVGTPFTGSIPQYNYYGSWMYKWNNGWDVVHGGDELDPFAGYCLTQNSATTHIMGGTLVPTTSSGSISVSGDVVLANSWTAPIWIGGFTASTFTSSPATIYLFNTGMAEDGSNEGTEAGTYVTVPVKAADYTGDEFIAPMQGFFVTNYNGTSGSITLNYNDLVRPAGKHTGIVAGPMYAKKQEIKPEVMKIRANGTQYSDRVVILAREDFSEGFDNGWDGEKLSFGAEAPSVYVINEQGGYDAVSAILGFEGTLVGFRAGTNNSCTMTFEYDGEEIWYLNDLQTQQSTLIDSELTYTFSTSSYDNEARFIISATPIRKITTGNESVGAEAAKVRKLIINDKLYIIRGGRMYSVDGAMIK